MSWAVATKDAESWVKFEVRGIVVFDPATFENRPIYDTGVQVPPWRVVATDAEIWTPA